MLAAPSRVVDRAYAATAALILAVLVAGGALLAATLPYHNWDAFGFGNWSRTIATGGPIDPLPAGQLTAGRPLFYLLQGGLWSLTGVSFTAGRLLSLVFAVALVVFVAAAAHAASGGRHGEGAVVVAATAAVLIVAIPSFTSEAIAGDTDVAAAAMVALCAWLAIRRRSSLPAAVGLGAAALAAMLTKPTAIAPLIGLAAWLLFERSRPLRERFAYSVAPVAVGMLAGAGYFAVMAARFHTWVIPFLRTTTSEGLWAQRAAAARTDAVFGLSVMGGALRLPFAFALVYGSLRVLGLDHRRAAAPAFVVGLLWAIVGPYSVGVTGSFATAEEGFAFIGFALLLAIALLAKPEDAPSRSFLALSLAIGLPPLAIWAYATAYFDRLAAAAWPGLALLIALSILPAIRVLARSSVTLALAPLTILAAAAWIGLGTLDGLHGHQWVEYRSLGLAGVWDRQRTMNIVLPQIQSTLATIEPRLGAQGRLSVSDPRFSFFLPGRVDTGVALHCSDVRGDAVFVLLTSDESEQSAADAGGLATPDQWAHCTSPKLEQVSDGSDGFAIFARA